MSHLAKRARYYFYRPSMTTPRYEYAYLLDRLVVLRDPGPVVGVDVYGHPLYSPATTRTVWAGRRDYGARDELVVSVEKTATVERARWILRARCGGVDGYRRRRRGWQGVGSRRHQRAWAWPLPGVGRPPGRVIGRGAPSRETRYHRRHLPSTTHDRPGRAGCLGLA